MAGEQDARRVAEIRDGLSDTTQGYCEDLDWENYLATINIGGARQIMPWAGTPPWPGDKVRVVYAALKPVCWAVHGPSQGTVVSVLDNEATVTGDDGQRYIYPTAVEVSSGDRVRIDHGGHLIVAVYPGDPAAADYVPSSPPPAQGGGSATFRPTDSANFRLGVYQSAFVEISDNRTGAYYYGTQFRDTVPTAARITKAELRLTELWDEVPDTPSKLGTHPDPTRGGAPTITGAIDVTGGGVINLMPNGDTTLPDRLKSGSAFGVGFPAAHGWRRFDTFTGSGAIYLEWS